MVIDGLGAYLTPGFIESQTEADHYLKIFTNPNQKDYLGQGVTTIIGGHGGVSLAPLLYGSLRALRKYINPNRTNVNWHSLEELIKELGKLPLGVNFGSFIGHSTVRREITNDAARDLTDAEIKVFKKIIRDAMDQGAFGLSVGLDTVHARRVPQQEIRELLNEVRTDNGLYSVGLRNNQEDLVGAVNETIFLYKQSGVKTIINQFQPLLGFKKQYQLALTLIEKSGDGLFFTISPEPIKILPAYQLLPEWCQVGGLEEMLQLINDVHQQKRLIEKLKVNGELVIKEIPASYHYLSGKTLKEFADNRKLPLARAFLELLNLTKMKLVVALPEIDEELLAPWLFHDRALITAPSQKFLELAEARRWPLEKAVAKLTALPAKVLGLKNRGLIKENYAADLVLIKDKKIQQVLVNGSAGGKVITL